MKLSYFKHLVAGFGVIVAIAVLPRPVLAQTIDPYFSSAYGPAVRIVTPANHAVFFAPVDVPILAYTRSDPSPTTFAAYTNVEFYANGQDLGPGILLCSNRLTPALSPPGYMTADPLGRLHEVWGLVWSNAPAGSYTLTAVARGILFGRTANFAAGLTRTSPPVDITILATPPPTNTLPDVVNIFARDPVAIAGTNQTWTWKGSPAATPAWTSWPPTTWGWFTNWGPKVALFVVNRCGNATSNLTVNYNISGTASNGVDYFMLPGYVNIPAGYSRALIPIVPIDHGASAGPKTVILTLAPDTNTPPDYIVGIPPRAEALIFERWLRPPPWLLPDGTFHLNATGPDGTWFKVESSTDFQNWTPISTNQVIQGSIDFADPNAPNNPVTSYIAVPVTNTPAD
jgi:hypothetical protein